MLYGNVHRNNQLIFHIAHTFIYSEVSAESKKKNGHIHCTHIYVLPTFLTPLHIGYIR